MTAIFYYRKLYNSLDGCKDLKSALLLNSI